MKWHLSHLHWHISNQDNDRHGPHTDTGLVRIHFLPHANIDIKKVLFLHTQTTEKKPALLGLYLNEVQWRPRLKCQNWSYVSAAAKVASSVCWFCVRSQAMCENYMSCSLNHSFTIWSWQILPLSWERKIHWKTLSFSIFRHIKLLNLHLKTTGRCSPICHVVRFFLSRQCTIKAVQKDYNN